MGGLGTTNYEHRLRLLEKRVERLEFYSDRFTLVLAQLIVVDVARGCGEDLVEWAIRKVAEYENSKSAEYEG